VGDPPGWATVEKILDMALDAEPSDRVRILEKECAGDTRLQSHVEDLLAECDRDRGFLERPAAEFAEALAVNPQRDRRVSRKIWLAAAIALVVVLSGGILLRSRFNAPIRRNLSPATPPRAMDSAKAVSDSLHRAGVALHAQGKFAEAETVLRRAAASRMMLAGKDQLPFAETLRELGLALHSAGRNPEAEAVLRESLGIYRLRAGAANLETASIETSLASVLNARNRHEEAESLLTHALNSEIASLPPDDPRITRTRGLLGATLQALGKRRQADSLIESAYLR
jgi:tetratricopeptide (TPR) repeat protein